MKNKIYRRLLVLVIIIFFLNSIPGYSTDVSNNTDTQKFSIQTFEKESFDLKIVSIEKQIYEPEPRDPTYEIEMEIVVKNIGASDFIGRIEFTQKIKRKGLGKPYIRTETTSHKLIKPGNTRTYRVFKKGESIFTCYFPGIYKVCYSAYPRESNDDDSNLRNNKQCKYFLLFLRFYYPRNNWFGWFHERNIMCRLIF